METMTLNLPNSIMSFLEAEAKRTGSTKEKITEQVLYSYIESLEDNHDLKVFDNYECEKENLKTRPISELWKELTL